MPVVGMMFLQHGHCLHVDGLCLCNAADNRDALCQAPETKLLAEEYLTSEEIGLGNETVEGMVPSIELQGFSARLSHRTESHFAGFRNKKGAPTRNRLERLGRRLSGRA